MLTPSLVNNCQQSLLDESVELVDGHYGNLFLPKNLLELQFLRICLAVKPHVLNFVQCTDWIIIETGVQAHRPLTSRLIMKHVLKHCATKNKCCQPAHWNLLLLNLFFYNVCFCSVTTSICLLHRLYTETGNEGCPWFLAWPWTGEEVLLSQHQSLVALQLL